MKKPLVLAICRGLLLAWTSLIGALGGLGLFLGLLVGGSGFNGQVYTGFGDHTMTASEVEKAQAETLSLGLALGLVVLLAVVAVIFFVCWRKYRHSTWILLGIAAVQMLIVVFVPRTQ